MSHGSKIPSMEGISKRIADARETAKRAQSPEGLTALQLAFYNRFQELINHA